MSGAAIHRKCDLGGNPLPLKPRVAVRSQVSGLREGDRRTVDSGSLNGMRALRQQHQRDNFEQINSRVAACAGGQTRTFDTFRLGQKSQETARLLAVRGLPLPGGNRGEPPGPGVPAPSPQVCLSNQDCGQEGHVVRAGTPLCAPAGQWGAGLRKAVPRPLGSGRGAGGWPGGRGVEGRRSPPTADTLRLGGAAGPERRGCSRELWEACGPSAADTTWEMDDGARGSAAGPCGDRPQPPTGRARKRGPLGALGKGTEKRNVPVSCKTKLKM